MLDFFKRQASEQYFTSSQFFAQDLRHVISLPQTKQTLVGKNDLLPLKPDFLESVMPTQLKKNRLAPLLKVRHQR